MFSFLYWGSPMLPLYTPNWSAVRPWQGLCLTIIGGSGAVLWPIRSIDYHVRREAVVLALGFTSSAVACLWCNPGSTELCQPISSSEWHFWWLCSNNIDMRVICSPSWHAYIRHFYFWQPVLCLQLTRQQPGATNIFMVSFNIFYWRV